jgi:CBS domain containing-hemolysin-like protein
VTTSVLIWLAIGSVFVGCFSAIAARSLREFSRRELEALCERRNRTELFADILHHHERVAQGVGMASIGLFSLAIVAASVWAWSKYVPLDSGSVALASRWIAFAALVVVVALVNIVAGGWLPWSIARIAAAPFLYYTWPVWKLVSRICFPLVSVAHLIDKLLHRITGRGKSEPDEETIEEEIRTIVSEGHREGLLEEDAREMIEGVIELRGAVVSHIMTPRTEMHMVQLDTPWDELVEDVIQTGHSRVPVYEKSRDDVVGILHSKDLLPELAKGSDGERRPLSALLRKPLFVPETKTVDELLSFLQKSRTHLAVVLDEYGGVSGLVTIEDVLEEIVGEIDDEYDKVSEDEIRKIDDDTCEALGRAHVDQINELMSFGLPDEEDFDTIGGFVFAELGRVPAVGETLTWRDSIRVTVLEASRRRVNRVRLERIRKESLEMA